MPPPSSPLTEPAAGDSPDDTPLEGFVVVVREGELRVPGEVEVEFTDGERERITWDGGRHHPRGRACA